MKNKIKLVKSIIIIAIFVIMSCTKAVDNSPCVTLNTKEADLITRASIEDFKVSLSEAVSYAKMSEPKKVLENVCPVVENQDTLMYFAYYDDGWKLISGDKRIAPELISEPLGKRTYDDFADGERVLYERDKQFIKLLRTYPSADKDKQYLSIWNSLTDNLRKENKIEKTRSIMSEVLYHRMDNGGYMETSDSLIVSNLTQTSWGQRYPYNTKFPISPIYYSEYNQPPTGCVAVAVSQLLYYLFTQKNLSMGIYMDVSMGGTYSGSSFSPSLTKDQYVMNPPYWGGVSLYSTVENSGTQRVQDVMLVVGEGVHMSYDVRWGSSNIINARSYLSSIGISSTLMSYDFQVVVSELMDGFPIYIRAYDPIEETGHAWLVDGYGKTIVNYYLEYIWETVDPSDPDFDYESGDLYLSEEEAEELGIYDGMTDVVNTGRSVSDYLLMNLGWDGVGKTTKYYEPQASAYWDVFDSYNYVDDIQILCNYNFPERD